MPSHVVHVEDRRRLRQILTSGFQAFEPTIKFQQFRTGDAALPYVTANGSNVDLFILALHFPGALDGLTLARHIRDLGYGGSIVLTSGSEAPAPAILGTLDCEFYATPWQILQLAPQLLNYPSPHQPMAADNLAQEGLSGAVRESLPQQLPSRRALRCPTCGQPRQPSQALCPQCNTIFSAASKRHTSPRSIADHPTLRDRSKGPVALDEKHDIVLHIGIEALVLPYSGEIALGCLAAPNAPAVVDLSRWGAQAMGVSRCHLRLIRKHGLLHAIDLNSTNGTWLNGRRLMPNSRYILRDGDHLALASFQVRVRFQPAGDARSSGESSIDPQTTAGSRS